MDLDHFKQINDTRGHDAGDFVLTELCALLRNTHMKREFTFARYGGEEFVVLCPGYSVAEAQPLAEAICEAGTSWVVRALLFFHTLFAASQFARTHLCLKTLPLQ